MKDFRGLKECPEIVYKTDLNIIYTLPIPFFFHFIPYKSVSRKFSRKLKTVKNDILSECPVLACSFWNWATFHTRPQNEWPQKMFKTRNSISEVRGGGVPCNFQLNV